MDLSASAHPPLTLNHPLRPQQSAHLSVGDLLAAKLLPRKKKKNKTAYHHYKRGRLVIVHLKSL